MDPTIFLYFFLLITDYYCHDSSPPVVSLMIHKVRRRSHDVAMNSSEIPGNCEIYSACCMDMNYSLHWTLKLTLLSLTLRDSVLNFQHVTNCPLSSKLKWVRINRNCRLIPALCHAYRPYRLHQEIMLPHNISPTFVEFPNCDLWHW